MLKTYRKEKELTQIELAELLDVSRRTIQNWEADEHTPRVVEYALKYLSQ